MEHFDDFTKAGFARLLKYFEDNTDDVVKLTRAFALANKAHKEAKPDSGAGGKDEPHINHLIRTALVLCEELQIRDSDLAAAALLHDSLGSASSTTTTTTTAVIITEDDVRSECGERVAAIVRALGAEPKKHDELEGYFARLAKEGKEARLVKIAAKLDRARSMKTFAYRDRALRFKDEMQKLLVPLAQNTDERLSFKLSVALYEIK
jgi:GTP pyrophosphokinase